MEIRKKSDDNKIIAALVCLFIGFAFVWNIAVNIIDIYDVKLDAETCEKVKTFGLVPSADCMVTAPFRQGFGPAGYLMLPDGEFLQVSPIDVNKTGRTAPWSTAMKVQFGIVLVFWVATLALLVSALREKK